MKPCFKCGVTKPLSEFYRDKTTSDGFRKKCKPCMKDEYVSGKEKEAKTCSFDGCVSFPAKRGMCDKHYRRFMKHGDASIVKKRANGDGYIENGYIGRQIGGVKKFEHVRVAEKALGKPLPDGAVVHHANEDKTDNRPENLVICPDRAYHNLIHARLEALKACGNADWVKCTYCKSYDNPLNLSQLSNGKRVFWHRECANSYNRQRGKK